MIVILQRYITKELFKASFLASLALTCMVGFGGSLVNLLRASDISADKLFKLLSYLLPIAFAYSLPVASLFGTTITYGRLSAANEVDACKASGINIYWLFLPAILLSVIVFVISFSFENFAIPELTHKAELLVSENMQSIFYSRLKREGYATYMDYALYCDRIDTIEEPRYGPDGSLEGEILLSGVAFLKHKNNVPVFYGTAKTSLVMFKMKEDTQTIHISLNQVVAFNENRGEVIEAEYYPLGPFRFKASFFKKKIKFLSLPMLLRIYKDPRAYEPLSEKIDELYRDIEIAYVYEYLYNELRDKYSFTFSDESLVVSLKADGIERNSYDGSIILVHPNITIFDSKDKARRILTAEKAKLIARKVDREVPPFVDIELENVQIRELGKDSDLDQTIKRSSYIISSLLLPSRYSPSSNIGGILPMDLIDIRKAGLNITPYIESKRFALHWYWKRLISRITAEINTRLVYSLSSLILLILGAALGILFKGGHFVSAFGLSFIPIGPIVVMILSGRQLCVSGYLTVGVLTIWSGLVITLLLTAFVLVFALKR